jgi:hypothetical protein
VFDKAGLTAAGRTFENDRKFGGMSGFEELNLPPYRQIIRLSGDSVILDGAFRHLQLCSVSLCLGGK